jgi:hypothetical protein
MKSRRGFLGVRFTKIFVVNYLSLIIDSYYQSIAIPFDVENCEVTYSFSIFNCFEPVFDWSIAKGASEAIGMEV